MAYHGQPNPCRHRTVRRLPWPGARSGEGGPGAGLTGAGRPGVGAGRAGVGAGRAGAGAGCWHWCWSSWCGMRCCSEYWSCCWSLC
eukprot:7315700-Pyramimonas_sp.AAC.1